MSDELGRRGSPGNVMKGIGRIIKLLEEIRNLLVKIANKSDSQNGSFYLEKDNSGQYTNKTGQRKGATK